MLSYKKPCTCGGSNENCFKCSGWGYVANGNKERNASAGNNLSSLIKPSKKKKQQPAAKAVVQKSVMKAAKPSGKLPAILPATKKSQPSASLGSYDWGMCKICKVKVSHYQWHVEKVHPRLAKYLIRDGLDATTASIVNAKPIPISLPNDASIKNLGVKAKTDLVCCPHCKAKVKVSRLPRHFKRAHANVTPLVVLKNNPKKKDKGEIQSWPDRS